LWQQDEESISHLTPEQQRQLAMIENMPYTIEKEQEDLELKTAEEKERILGIFRHDLVFSQMALLLLQGVFIMWLSLHRYIWHTLIMVTIITLNL